eukprot:gene9495-10311_t
MSDFAAKRGRDEEGDHSAKKPRSVTTLTAEDENLLVNTIRILSADMVEKANSGHPGAPMGCAPIAHALFGSIMNYSPKDHKWFNRDRFVLSNGHACALLYSMLHLTGYDLSIDDLKQFRQLGSLTPGHPENFVTPGVEVSTGPLGQGISNAVGLAIAEKHLAAVYNRDGYDLIDHYTYVLCGDGCLQEGISSEASSLAGHLGLGKLIVCYDDNLITIDGSTSLSFTEDVGKRYEAYNWHVQTVSDGNDIAAINQAIENAKAETHRPSLIKIRTVIGFGSTKAGTGGVHGSPLGAKDLAQAKEKFGFDPTQSFVVPQKAYDYYQSKINHGKELVSQWNELLQSYAQHYPDLAKELNRRIAGQLPENWKNLLPKYSHTDTKAVATRSRSEEVINALAATVQELVGGSADLTPSNLTLLKCSGDFQKDTPQGRYLRFGVREHAMAAVCNGLFAHGGIRPYGATFLNFIGYAMGSVRLSALSKFGVIYVMTHDSIGLGEDGPTHQPVEMLEALRTTPNLLTLRPADGNETSGSYLVALEHAHTPSVISLSRQGVPTLEGSSIEKVALGAYVLKEWKHHIENLPYPTLTLISTGTEVSLAVKTAQALYDEIVQHDASQAVWIRVVSAPCLELFDQQSSEYQKEVLIPGSPVMSIEASGVAGVWRQYAHAVFGIPNQFGMSAPADQIYKAFGFDVPNLVKSAKDVIHFYTKHNQQHATAVTPASTIPFAPSLFDVPKFNNHAKIHH